MAAPFRILATLPAKSAALTLPWKFKVVLKSQVYIHPNITNTKNVSPRNLTLLAKQMIQLTMLLPLPWIIEIENTQFIPATFIGYQAIVTS